MKRILAAVAAALGLLASAGHATAAPGDDALQLAAAAQAAAGAQAAGAQSGASQSHPSNTNVSVRVFSPGDDGDVTQSNSVSSNATAANANVTDQSASQTQSGSCGCGSGTQAAGQSADSSQTAGAVSYAEQSGASNTNIPVRVFSDGSDGDVEQSNSVASDATAANINGTGQSVEQAGAGGGTQAVGQQSKSEQDAAAASKAEQRSPKNTNISVRVFSDGDNGKVKQSNDASSSATAGNANLTGQTAGQGPGSGGTQAIGQKAYNDQSALALSAAKQDHAKNTNTPVRVFSDGHGGDVEQSNNVESKATAGNLNGTKQEALQGGGRGSETCGCASGGEQAIGQSAGSKQAAGALSIALQSGASNTNAPVRVDSKGGDGDVTQSNSVGSRATALNVNLTGQKAAQTQGSGDCHCTADGKQAIGQEAKSDQTAVAGSLAAQLGGGGKDRCGCGSGSFGNTNGPVSVDSDSGHGRKHGGGDVEQSNDAYSSAGAGNLNLTGQHAAQGQGGSGTQAIGQEAKNHQGALALSAALQAGASNENAPVRVDSKGGGGDVSQSNSVGSHAGALNGNLTKQEAGQLQGGSACGCESLGIQAIGQKAHNEQGAGAFSLGLQHGASNRNAPVGVDSKGGGGSVEQSNTVGSSAKALNLNALGQHALQGQGGGGILVQAIGQKAKNEQKAIGLSAALQSGASNSSAPVAIDGKGEKYGKHDAYDKRGKKHERTSCRCEHGGGGSVEQSNDASSAAKALNANLLHQGAAQRQDGGRCGCDDHVGVQALGQSADSAQGALSASLALQCGARRGLSTDYPDGYGSRAAPKPRKESAC